MTAKHLKIQKMGDAVLGVRLEGNPKKPDRTLQRRRRAMKPATYRNPWHKTVKGSPEFYTAYSDKPNKSYRGIDIYLRASGYDFVANGTCFTQRAGISRYKEVIDDILDTQGDVDIVRCPDDTYWVHVRNNHPEDGNDHMNKRASRRIVNNMINDLRREEA